MKSFGKHSKIPVIDFHTSGHVLDRKTVKNSLFATFCRARIKWRNDLVFIIKNIDHVDLSLTTMSYMIDLRRIGSHLKVENSVDGIGRVRCAV